MAAAAAVATVTAVAGSGERGFEDGPAAVAEFGSPTAVAVAPDGSYFVADAGNHAVRRVAPDGAVTTVAGTGEWGRTDGPGEVATFDGPAGIVVDRQGDIFVTERGAGRVRKITRHGGGWVVSTVVAAGLNWPTGIAVDPAGHLVVADRGNHRVVRVNPTTGVLTAIAGDGTRGFRDGPGATRFHWPKGVAVDRHGDIFVADWGNHRVQRISAADGTVSAVAGCEIKGHIDGAGAAAQFTRPTTIAVDGRGVLLVSAGTAAFRLRRIAATADRTVTTVAWEASDRTVPIGVYGVAIDRDGSVLLAAQNSYRIFRVTGLGLVPPSAPTWSLRAHRGFAAAAPPMQSFVAAVLLCAHRLDVRAAGGAVAAVPRLPLEMWLAILSMLRPDQMVG